MSSRKMEEGGGAGGRAESHLPERMQAPPSWVTSGWGGPSTAHRGGPAQGFGGEPDSPGLHPHSLPIHRLHTSCWAIRHLREPAGPCKRSTPHTREGFLGPMSLSRLPALPDCVRQKARWVVGEIFYAESLSFLLCPIMIADSLSLLHT